MKYLLLCFLLAANAMGVNALSAGEDFKAHISVNGGDLFKVEPGKPFTIELYFTDPRTEEVYKDFKVMHGKLMHMVLVKKDLSVFRHIHPYYDPATGRFSVSLNLPVADPDNQHITNALTEPGKWMVMADVEIQGVGMRMAHFMLTGFGSPETKPLELDPINGDLSITKHFRRPGQKSGEKPHYKATLSYQVTSGCMANLNDFFLEIYALNESGAYEPVTDLSPWLGTGGHAIWLSQMAMQNMKMQMAHMHSEMPVDDHILLFNYFDKATIEAGKQKLWIQFRHQDVVLTFPFIFEYYPPPITGDNC